MPFAVAAPSPLAAEAAAATHRAGGNAVDAALAAALVACLVEPGVCAPGAGGFITVAPPSGYPVVIDGYMRAPLSVRNDAVSPVVEMEYGGGVKTMVGPGSVAVPGCWAAFGLTHQEFGRLGWSEVCRPIIDIARRGFPLGPVSAYYLQYSGEPVFGVDPASRQVLRPDGKALSEGEPVLIADLAETLEVLAADGPEVFYRGALGKSMGEDLWERGGRVGVDDFLAYRAIERLPLAFELAGWSVFTNPAPAVGGAAVAYLLKSVERGGREPDRWIEAMDGLFAWRAEADDPVADRLTLTGRLLSGMLSPSTVHISAIDDTGLAASITMSAGYGSGVIPTGTGMWMNNALGEFELVGTDLDRLPPGEPLNSNMAPTVAVGPKGEVLAIGGPGADRISSSLAQVLAHLVLDGDDLTAAVARPRLHVDIRNGGRVAIEPGVELGHRDRQIHAYDRPHMYFGAVGAAHRRPDGTLEAVTDSRRNGMALVI